MLFSWRRTTQLWRKMGACPSTYQENRTGWSTQWVGHTSDLMLVTNRRQHFVNHKSSSIVERYRNKLYQTSSDFEIRLCCEEIFTWFNSYCVSKLWRRVACKPKWWLVRKRWRMGRRETWYHSLHCRMERDWVSVVWWLLSRDSGRNNCYKKCRLRRMKNIKKIRNLTHL